MYGGRQSTNRGALAGPYLRRTKFLRRERNDPASTVADISMSLDGFVTGPDPDLDHGLGHGGEPLHTWAIDSDDEIDAEVLATRPTSGAVVMGRRLFDIIDGPKGWNDEMGYGAAHAHNRRSSS